MENPNGTNKIADWQLRQRQALPLDAKIELTKRRIKQWCDEYDDMVYVAFSGGLDSTVLLHIARQVFPECPAVFHDTGLEYPEIRDFVKTVDNVEWVKPKKTFKQALEEDGFPVVSKRVSQYVKEVQRSKSETATKKLRLTGIKPDGRYNGFAKIPNKWLYLVDAPYQISDNCCKYFKKQPAEEYETRTGSWGMVGTRTQESQQRELTYLQFGCNGFDLTRPRSTPLAFWLDEDIKEYFKKTGIPYSKIYDMGYTRTGCMFCLLGCHLETGKNRFQMMEETHPKQHKYCMEKLGLREVLEHIGVNGYNTQLDLFDNKGENE